MRAARSAASTRQPIDIEELLVWTYRAQKADQVIRRGAGLHALEALADGVEIHATSACGCAGVARIAELGVRVDQMGRDSGALHPDAEVVHRAVMQLDDKVQGLPRSRLVIVHAARAERPGDLACEIPRPVPRLNRNGSVQVQWLDQGRKRGFCPIDYQPSVALIDAAREEYAAWHAALRLLHLALHDDARLTRWHPLRPAAPAEPWNHA
jgi:hypothetical protein